MNRKESIRQFEQQSRLEGMGVSSEHAEALRRISMTLSRWAERECNGEVEVDEDGKAYGTNAAYSTGTIRRWRLPNREAGALRRLATIMAYYPGLWAYHQTDPRGCALYIGFRADLRGADVSTCYHNGLAVY